MKKCAQCNEVLMLPYTCKYCGELHCVKHRQPENHNCNGFGFKNGKPISETHQYLFDDKMFKLEKK